jgi:hypothetical protein
MPKTEYLGLYVMSSREDPIRDFVDSMVEGAGTEASPLSDPQKLDNAIKALNENKQSKLTPGNGITIAEDGTISVSFINGDEVAY